MDRILVQNTSGSTFWKTNRASPCKYHAPDPNPNPSPNHRDVYMSMRSTWCAILSRITDAMIQVRGETAAGWRCFSGSTYCRTNRSSAVVSVQLNSHVLRSIGTTALYCHAYNALGSAALHSTVRSTTVSGGTVSPVCCDASNASKCSMRGCSPPPSMIFRQTDQSQSSILLGWGGK